ncbi:MAG: capsular polysaccharide biosynthesis protein, partial [Pseudomonadota bacterium]
MNNRSAEAAGTTRRLFVYNGGLLARGRVRRILELAGWDVRIGRPRPGDRIGVWGRSPTSPRGEAIASLTSAPLVRIEDAFLRSLHPGRTGSPPLGLLVDELGVHFDASVPSSLERLLTEHPLDDDALLERAREGMRRMKAAHLSKYAAVLPEIAPPEAGFVLLIDQTRGDASIEWGGASEATFDQMLSAARIDHPEARIVIKTHPETASGHRAGHFSGDDEGTELLSEPVSPWHILEAAKAVYTVSSGLGFEAILAGHRPKVFGQPWYAGWGLTDDLSPPARRGRSLTAEQLFAAAMILSPVWYDPHRDALASFETALAAFEAEAKAWRMDRLGWVATGMRRWKHRPLQR